MLRPSYTDLLEAIKNDGVNEDIAASRYTIVIAAAKRARQLVDNPEALTECDVERQVSIAVKELYEGKVKITAPEKIEDEAAEEIVAEDEAADEVIDEAEEAE